MKKSLLIFQNIYSLLQEILRIYKDVLPYTTLSMYDNFPHALGMHIIIRIENNSWDNTQKRFSYTTNIPIWIISISDDDKKAGDMLHIFENIMLYHIFDLSNYDFGMNVGDIRKWELQDASYTYNYLSTDNKQTAGNYMAEASYPFSFTAHEKKEDSNKELATKINIEEIIQKYGVQIEYKKNKGIIK